MTLDDLIDAKIKLRELENLLPALDGKTVSVGDHSYTFSSTVYYANLMDFLRSLPK